MSRKVSDNIYEYLEAFGKFKVILVFTVVFVLAISTILGISFGKIYNSLWSKFIYVAGITTWFIMAFLLSMFIPLRFGDNFPLRTGSFGGFVIGGILILPLAVLGGTVIGGILGGGWGEHIAITLFGRWNKDIWVIGIFGGMFFGITFVSLIIFTMGTFIGHGTEIIIKRFIKKQEKQV